ncbi:bifunctional diaminohydroxyphosphoribosylaminopyrimidine deaminase/5-amino-6-(5-phosphoribosylamino)uracil reductase RibD [Sphingopyxis sp. XHP0097]|uniref:Riboflavin biosynthesis protein RibD n=1 Tax=Sphingopyxis jiangsuensis TaxID=2871171 RepID=A0ABS7MEK4_9SPHN|nr:MULTISPECIES: bifunctional diaminohydroxyphosphoribosylaminopyrimidine deaminase/5-amino-6-(5-phosphoribosylamino)uracil reductase RibD [Sphingopyxis]MBL0769432.1 bifunctional diaminohydroxyphosphoribosylaminopyrimidine deaminase/5-amino-6-(5-phosphoribosylamino)uracil reductase RibD [Sphingopyxis lutea]MBY4637460.1 bifunctional diaminohydroxyphosphoribosylaminopyrimidine deaminase/5-amino-6-(5-phosphoribosylamino)uracil reductase RibD [Sphingopyxis jiangsuensis]
MATATALSQRAYGLSAPNPNVGCILVAEGKTVGRGWTQPAGRPHAEAMALAAAGARARGATAYVTLEPCAHASPRGPCCADALIDAGVARVVVALQDPDPRTDGRGIARLREAGVEVDTGVGADAARAAMAPWWSRATRGRPFVTLKLATSLDGCIARADGTSRWITGARARAHAHLERARHEGIVAGRGTLDADAPRLDVRLAGLEARAPRRYLLTRGMAPDGWTALSAPDADPGVDSLLVEGGAGAASAFLAADRVDRLLLYRAPILIGDGKSALGDIGLADLAAAHGRWRLVDSRMLGSDRLDVYERVRKE